jgi:putative glycosyltransferase (exosortase G-associated)
MVWIIIPLIMEITPAFMNFLILIKKKLIRKKYQEIVYYPEITLIIPVYNSADTLRECIASVVNSDYPQDMINLMLVNNQGQDNSFEVFQMCQKEFPELKITWMNSKQGKSKALNLALFNSSGKYIIHIDSDGILHPKALRNVVTKMENEENTHCVTGVIMTNSKMVEETGNKWLKLLRRAEYFEYTQAFLAGRNYQSESNSIYTMSGAFSAFRKSTILRTQLYNTDTVGEDTHVTFQVRNKLKLKVKLCENAIYFVDPIENMDKLYTQRQRWQRGELEVAHVFLKSEMNSIKRFVSNFAIRLLMYDHTFAFPRMIWYFALICLVFLNYPLRLLALSLVLIYLLYTFSGFLFYLNVLAFLSEFKDIKKYYRRLLYMVVIMPAYNFLTFWFRFAGIINSIRDEQSWKTKTLTQEYNKTIEIIRYDFRHLTSLRKKIKGKVTIGQDNEE